MYFLQKIYLAINICLVLCNTSTLLISKEKDPLPYPYNTVTLLSFNDEGYFGKIQAIGLSYLIKKYQPKIIVEIGSYLGKSTRYIAKLLPPNGTVYAVDHWLGNAEWYHQPHYAEKQNSFYQQFLSNVIHEGLCNKIVPIKMTSLEAATSIEVTPDLVFIDGSHDYNSVYKDICAWYKRLNNEGLLCGDDYGWGKSRPVKKAVDQFAKENNLRVKLVSNWFWYYEKK